MRFLPLLLVLICAAVPIEELARTLEHELVIRSVWSLLLCAALYSCISTRRLVVILCCEFFSIGYNLALALGYYFTDKDLSALYEPVMVFLVGVEIIAVLPGRTRRDSRDNRGGGNRYNRRSFIARNVAHSEPVQVAACKI